MASEQEGPFERRAELVWHLPFWFPEPPPPMSPGERGEVYTALADGLNAHTWPDGFDDVGPTSWTSRRMRWYEGEPSRIAALQRWRLEAPLPDRWLVEANQGLLRQAGHPRMTARAGAHPSHRSMLRYEDLGLGMLEYVIQITSDDEGAWRAWLHDTDFWRL